MLKPVGTRPRRCLDGQVCHLQPIRARNRVRDDLPVAAPEDDWGRWRSRLSFAAQIPSWQAFFATVAGLTATLSGLLFVGLGLNPRILATAGPVGMRVLAAQTFHNFLVVLVIALIALLPDDTAHSLAVTLLIVGMQGVLRV